MEHLQFRVIRWYHECPIATLTLAVLLHNHGGALQTLEFRKKTNFTALGMANLSTHKIGALDTLGADWPIHLLAKNFQNLRDLQLSNETETALNYSVRGSLGTYGPSLRPFTDRQIKLLKTDHHALTGSTAPILHLDSLSLCGFGLNVIVQASSAPLFDFNNLSRLIIRSCSGLNKAFPMLMGANGTRRDTMGTLHLRTLIMRHENADNIFMLMLKSFLVSLAPLTTLHILLEGGSETDILGECLKPHGKSLGSLIWDERSTPRTHIQLDTTSTDVGNLKHIAKHCIKLRALGIPLHWQELTGIDSDHSKVSHFVNLALLRLYELTPHRLPHTSPNSITFRP